RSLSFLSLLDALPLFAELLAYSGRSLALRAFRRDPDDAPRDGNLFLLAHDVQEHEDLVAELVARVRRDEQAAVFHERHVREVERSEEHTSELPSSQKI